MKQKKIGDILYVFDVTPYEITSDTDAELIKVQQEVVAGFKELNASLADNIVAYNYHVMTATEQEWAPYVEQDDPEPEQKQNPGLAWSDESYTAEIGNINEFPTLSNPYNVTVTYSSSDTEKATINQSTGEITLVAAGDTTISAIFAGNDTYEAQTVTYTLTVEAEYEPEYYTVTLTGTGLSDETVEIRVGEEPVEGLTSSYEVREDEWFEIYPLQDPDDYTLVSNNMEYSDEGSNEHWYVMPNENMTIELNYVAPLEDPELAWSANSATISMKNTTDEWHLPTLSNPNNVTVTYSSSNQNVAQINSSGEISTIGPGETEISAIYAGSDTYSASTVSYDLTVENGDGPSGES